MKAASVLHDSDKTRTLSDMPIRVGRLVVGHLRGERFYNFLRAAVHFLRSLLAIALDLSSLRKAERVGAWYAHISDAEYTTLA